jgi:uncharacterized coiled-coil protein SlyX
MTDTNPTQQLFDLWKRQLEEGVQTWSRLAGQAPTPPFDPTAFWRPFVDQWTQAWARMAAQTPFSPDLAAQWKQFADQAIESWARALGQTMGTEAFAQVLGRSLDQWLTAVVPMKKATDQSLETTLQSLNLPSRSQVTGLARQVADLDDRIERLEDAMTALVRQLQEVARVLAERPSRREAP